MAVSMLYLFLYSKHLSLVLEPGKYLNLWGGQKQEKLNFNNRNQKVVALQWGREKELIKKGTTALLNFVHNMSNVSLYSIAINFVYQPRLGMGQFLIGVY